MYKTHAGMTDDPNGDIHEATAGDRAKIQTDVAAMQKTKAELVDLLYECLVSAQYRRNITEVLTSAQLIMELKGWTTP